MNMPVRPQPQTLEQEVAFEAGALAIISKAEIDMQIATAHRFPRSVTKFREEAEALVTLTEDIADECIYSLARRDKDGNDVAIEGPSSRFAEVIASTWGNCRAGARVIDDTGEFVTAQGAFHDLERNVAISYEVKRRIVDRRGNRYSADMIGVTANAACSIALRNAILKGVPKALWSSIYEAAKRTLMGDYKTLASRRQETLERFKKLGVSADRVYQRLGIRGEDDLSIELVFQLRTILTAIKEGDTTPEEQFPVPPKPSERSAESALKGAVTPEPAEKPGQPKTEGQTEQPKAPAGKTPGTPEIRDKIIASLKAKKDIDALAEEADKANLYEWTAPDLSAINAVYHERVGALT